jgi:hypothetical protein
MVEITTEDMIMKISKQKQQIKSLLKLNPNSLFLKVKVKVMCQKISLIQIQLMVVSVQTKVIFSDTKMAPVSFSANQVLAHLAQQLEYI